jgi:alanine racemase
VEKQQNVGYRPTWAQIDLDNLTHNYHQIKDLVSPGVKIMACVKAEAYGHGLIQVSRQLASCGVDFLAVASVDEAIALRKAGIDLRVLVLGLALEQDLSCVFEYRITPTVCSLSVARELSRQARLRNQTVDVHIKVDTGMGRIGIIHDKAYAFVKKISNLPNIRIEGIFTHLACADTDEKLTGRQIRLFGSLVKRLRDGGVAIPLVHAANSMGVIAYKGSHFNMVRPGLVLYGLRPCEDAGLDIRPVMALKTRVVFIKDVKAGSGVSYGHTYVTSVSTRIATLPIGYGDGYPRNLSNIGPVLINGQRFSISGRICMDQVMVDVGAASVKVGDEAVLIGKQGGFRISAETLAAVSETIPYEIVCGIGSRVPRVYTHKSLDLRKTDSRKTERFLSRIPVRFLDTPALSSTLGLTEDISAGGIKIFTPEPVLPYRKYNLSLEAANKKPVYLSGTSVWSRPASNGRYVCGIELSRPLKKPTVVL